MIAIMSTAEDSELCHKKIVSLFLGEIQFINFKSNKLSGCKKNNKKKWDSVPQTLKLLSRFFPIREPGYAQIYHLGRVGSIRREQFGKLLRSVETVLPGPED